MIGKPEIILLVICLILAGIAWFVWRLIKIAIEAARRPD